MYSEGVPPVDLNMGSVSEKREPPALLQAGPFTPSCWVHPIGSILPDSLVAYYLGCTALMGVML